MMNKHPQEEEEKDTDVICLGCRANLKPMLNQIKSERKLNEDGHFFLCVHCGTLMIYKKSDLFVPTEDEFELLKPKVKMDIMNYQMHLRRTSGIQDNMLI